MSRPTTLTSGCQQVLKQHYDKLLDDWCDENNFLFGGPQDAFLKTVAQNLDLSSFDFLNQASKSSIYESFLESGRCTDSKCETAGHYHQKIMHSIVQKGLQFGSRDYSQAKSLDRC